MAGLVAREISPSDLFALEYVHDGRLSADGRRIAYVTSRTEHEQAGELFEITVLDLTSESRQKLPYTGLATHPRWSPDGMRLAFIGSAEGRPRLYICDADGGGLRALTSEEWQVQGPPTWAPDGATIAYSVLTNKNSAGVHRVKERLFRAEGLGAIDDLRVTIHVAEVRTGVSRPFETGVRVAMEPAFSPCGTRILFLGADAARGYPPLDLKPFIIDLRNGELSRVLGDGWYIAHAAWSPCGERIAFAGDFSSPLTIPIAGLWVVNCDGSSPTCRTSEIVGNVGVLVHHDMPTWGTSQNHYFVVASSMEAYATVTRRGCTEIYQVALTGPARSEPVAAGSRSCVIMDVNSNSSTLLFAVSDFESPWELHLASTKGGEERALTALNTSVLSTWPKLKVEHLEFQSEDGLPIEAWHLARADREGPRPTVLFIHGGPELCVGHAFRFDFHLLAANGFAVLAVNFRGSSGYGEPFRLALQGNWGTHGFPDYMAAVDAAISRGLADPSRLGVWGPSHGGYATCWVVGHTNRFRAAVAESAVTNLSTFYYLSDLPDIFIKEFGGRPNEIPEVYQARSPLTYAAHCRTPTLMLHGEADLRCPISEAEQFYRALHDAGCSTELVRVPGMTHMGDSTGPLPVRAAQNEALLEWFERHL